MGRLTFLGAARTVTGSHYLLEAGGSGLLVDCGMFQGERALRAQNWAPPAPAAIAARWLVLTHAHIDHTGRVPRLVRQGFRGPIYCTPASRELAEILLEDAAHLQEEDAAYLNRKGLTRHQPALPLFTAADVEACLRLFEAVPLGEERALSTELSFTLRDAGHLLGAASVDVTVREGGKTTRVLFSGDVGRFDTIVARDPEPAPAADYIVMESTYGNRAHAAVPLLDQLQGVLERTFARGGVVLIPAFAVGRAQQMIYLMDRLVTTGRLRPFPVHLDSPMAIEATRIYSRFPADLRPEMAGLAGRSILYNKWVQVHRSRAESQKLNDLRGPAVILSSSGMLTGGRILHHCRVRLPHAENTLLITGHQGPATLGRALLEGARVVRIHKSEVPVLAEVTELRGLSGHADPGELIRWLSGIDRPPRRVFLTHGEEEAALALAARLQKERGFTAHVPEPGEAVELGAGAAA
jgi:metallo-beta-lactamase family protein